MRIIGCLTSLVLIIAGCSNKRVTVVITNQRDTALRNVLVTNGRHSFSIHSILPGRSSEASLSFKDMPLVDGAYQLQIDKRRDSLNNRAFGYFSNGNPSDSKINVLVYNDSFGFKSDLNHY
jgi:hypothetical protein